MSKNDILWIPFYRELADKLIAYKDNRPALLEQLHEIFRSIGMQSPFVERTQPMPDVDPFSVFGCFNKGLTSTNRTKILTGFADKFNIRAAVPTNFDGIPTLNNLRAFFFAFSDHAKRNEHDIDNLWQLFLVALRHADAPTEETKDAFAKAFDMVRDQALIRWNITMGLYWIRPYSYINLDDRNRQFLGMGKVFPPVDAMIAAHLKKVPSGTEYLGIIEDCKKAFQHPSSAVKNFVELSQHAWIATTADSEKDTTGYWPLLSEYDPKLSKEDWKKYILEVELPDHPQPMQMLKAMMEQNGQASCKRLSELYGGTPNRYIGCTMNLGRRAKKYFNLPACMDEGQERYFAIPFVGKRKLDGDKEYYVYRIRPELFAALKEIDLSDVSLYVTGEEETMDAVTDVGLNTILYGPPGTGKTYHTVFYAVAIIENKKLDAVKAEPYKDVLNRYNEYKAQGRIEFTTFHQSYGYEEFIEGIKPKPIDSEYSDDEGQDIQYSVQPGIFNRFCTRAETPADTDIAFIGINEAPNIWKVSLWGTGDNPIRTECLKNGHIRIGWDDYGDTITKDTDFSDYQGKTVLNAFFNRMQVGDIVLSCYSAKTIDAIGVITGEPEWQENYQEFKRVRKVDWLVKNINENIMDITGNKVMNQKTIYSLTVSLPDVLNIVKKHKTVSTLSITKKQNYVFIIDEINRGNISKIFGELITLIEESKRVGKEEGMKTLLPYSMKPFGVPENVYIIGTMNTADRSIATIDTALRRRFAFKEMPPDPEVVADIHVGDLSIKELLTRMNQRIAVLYDREHTIGHAYFKPLEKDNSMKKLAEIFKNKVIPLLQEYFYEDYEKIRLVLGDNQKAEQDQFIQAKKINPAELFGGADIGLDDGFTYEINEDAYMNPEAYRLK